MSHYSSWVNLSSQCGYAFFAVLLWITLIVGFVREKALILILFPWWFFVIASMYVTLMAIGSSKHRFFGTVAKVYAPFMVFLYWSSVYWNHDPWRNSTDTFLVLMAHIFLPGFIIVETIRPKNTHYALFRQINADFLISASYLLNTVVYVIYFAVYLIVLTYDHDPIYKTLGFSLDKSEDSILGLIGWSIVMFFNTLIVCLTWVVKDKENVISRMFLEHTSLSENPKVQIYVMDRQ